MIRRAVVLPATSRQASSVSTPTEVGGTVYRKTATVVRGKSSIWTKLGAVCLLAGAMLGGSSMQAQTAHYTQAVISLGTGVFSDAFAVATDIHGNVYVSDTRNNAVKEILAVGGVIPFNPVIRTLASGFNSPSGVAVDGSGNVYVADMGNSAVKEILAVGGVIPSSPTVNPLGSGFNRPSGVAVDGSGNVYVADTHNNAVKEILAVSGVIPASSPTINPLGSGFTFPEGIAVDGSGNVYVGDSSNNAVKEILAVGGVIPASSPVINPLGSGFFGPEGVAVDGSGNVYVADPGNGVVKKILAVGGVIPSSSPVIHTLISEIAPSGVAVDGNGNVYAADPVGNTVKGIMITPPNFGALIIGSSQTFTLLFTFDTAGTIGAPIVLTQGITGLDFTDAGTGSCTTLGTSHSYAVNASCTVNVTFTPKYPGQRFGAVELVNNAGNVIATVLISGTGNGPLAAYTPGMISTVAGTVQVFAGNTTGDGGQATAATFTGPQGVSLDGAGNMYIADSVGGDGSVRKVTAATGVITTIAGGGSFTIPTTPATVPPTTMPTFTAGIPCPGTPSAIATDTIGDGCPAYNSATPADSVILFSPEDAIVDGAGNVYISDNSHASGLPSLVVHKLLASTGIMTLVAGGGTATFTAGTACPGTPSAIAINALGDGCPAANAAIPADSAKLSDSTSSHGPYQLALDGAGNLYIADINDGSGTTTHPRIRMVSASTGIITTVAGGGTATFTAGSACPGTPGAIAIDTSGDGCPAYNAAIPADSATVTGPYGVALDSAGNIYISDLQNISNGLGFIRRVDAVTGIITSIAGGGSATATGTVCHGASGLATDTVGDGCPAYNVTTPTNGAKLTYPEKLTVDSAGNIYFADNALIRKITTATGIITAIAGTNAAGFTDDSTPIPATSAKLNGPIGVFLDGTGKLYFTDQNNGRVRMVDSASSALAFSSTAVNATSAPLSVALANNGNADLSFPAPGSGMNPSLAAGFSYSNSSTCAQIGSTGSPFILAAGATCLESISFAPTAPGATTGSLIATDNSLSGSTQTVALSGTGGAGQPTLGLTLPDVSFSQGQINATYTLTPNNTAGTFATAGTLTLVDTLPAGITATAMTGTGWTCTVATVTCTSTTSIAAGATGNAVTLTVSVAADAVSGTDSATLSLNDGLTQPVTATDTTAVNVQQTVFVVNATTAPATGTASNCAAGNADTCSLPDALAGANLGSAITSITFDPTVFPTTGTTPVTLTLTGSLPVINAVNTMLTLTGPGESQLTIDGSGGSFAGIVKTGAGSNVTISGLTFSGFNSNAIKNATSGTLAATNVTVTGGTAQNAVSNTTGMLALNNCTVTNVHAATTATGAVFAGAVSNSGGTLNINGCTITGNSDTATETVATTLEGAGVTNASGTLNVTNSTISGNSLTLTSSGANSMSSVGGGIYNAGTAVITGSTIGSDGHGNSITVTNTATTGGGIAQAVGGGIYNSVTGTLTITKSSIGTGGASNRISAIAATSTRTSIAEGAGIANGDTTVTKFSMSGSTVSGNTVTCGNAALGCIATGSGGFGGGIYSASGLTLDGTSGANTISGNTTASGSSSTANILGGGIYVATGIVTLTDATISGNSSGNGGGIYLAGSGASALTNIIVTGNVSTSAAIGGIFLNRSSGAISLNNITLYSNGASSTSGFTSTVIPSGVNNILGDCVASKCPTGATNITAPTNLGTLADNGGGVLTILPGAGSNVIGAGVNCTTAADERGYPRTTATCDVGAVRAATSGAATVTVVASTIPPTMTSAILSASVAFTGSVPAGAFSFQVDSGAIVPATCTGSVTPLSCTASYTTTGLALGAHTITGKLAADANFDPATGTNTLTVALTPQTITFTPPASPVDIGVSPITLVATGGASGNPVTFSIDSSSTGTGTLSGTNNNTLTITGPGSIVLDANQAGNATYAAATQAQQTIVVNPITQTITFTAPTTPVVFGVSPITLTATGGASTNPVTFSIDSSSTGTGTLSGTNNSILTVTGAGSIVLDADQAGNTSYAAATQAQQTIVVNQATQTITFTAPATATYGDSAITLSATGGASSNAVTFSITSGSSFGTLSGTNNSVLTITGAGSITVTASQAGNTNYAAATNVPQTIVVGKATQAIGFTALSSPVVYGVSPITLSATGGASANPVTFSIDSSSTIGAGSLSGNVLTVTGPGSIVLDANQVGDANYAAAPQAQQTVAVTQAPQVINFTAPATVAYPSAPITLSATGGASGNPVTFSITAGSAFGSLNNNILTILGPGSITIAADQAGSTAYSAAPQVTATISVLASSSGTPTTAVGSSGTITATFVFNSSVTLNSSNAIQVLTQGATTPVFTNANSIATNACTAGTSYDASHPCTVNVTFTPKAPGLYRGGVNLLDGSGNVIGTVFIAGNGSGGLGVFQSGVTQNTFYTGVYAANGINFDGAGNLYVADDGTARVLRISPSGIATTIADSSTLTNSVFSVAVDGAGDLYIADPSSGLFRIAPGTTCLTVGACTPIAGIANPSGVAVDGAGTAYIVSGSAVSKIVNGIVMPVTTGITTGSFADVDVDAAGTLYIADNSGQIYSVAAGATTATTLYSSTTIAPEFIRVDPAGNLYFTDNNQPGVANTIYELPVGSSTPQAIAFTGSELPYGIALDASGNLYTSAEGNSAPSTDVILELTRNSAGLTVSGNTTNGTSVSAGSVTFANIGNASLADTFVAGTNTALDAANACATSLASKATCSLAVDFAPTTVATPVTGTVTLANNGAGSALTLTVSGNTVAATSKLVFGAPPVESVTAGGNAGSATILEQNASGDTVTTASDDITITVTGPTGFTTAVYGPAPATGGVATFGLSAALTIPGTYTYTATSGSLTSAVATETVTPGALAALVVSGYANPASLSTAGSISVTAEDAYSNVITAFTGAVAITSSDAAATLPSSHTFVVGDAGVHSFNVTLNSAGTQSITATSGAIAGSQTGIVVNKAAPSIAGTTVTQTYGTSTSSTVTVTGTTGGPTPTGNITYKIDSASAVTVALTSGSVSVPVSATLGGGAHTITLTYVGDSNYSAITTGTGTSVGWTSSTYIPTVSGTAVTQTYGTATSTTVSVSAPSGGAAPTGTITYKLDSGSAQTATLASGTATINIAATLSGGSHTITLAYGGDTNYAAVTTGTPVTWTTAGYTATVSGTTVTQTYGTATSTTLSVSSPAGGATPTGTITYALDGGTAQTATLASGTATVNIAATLAAGAHTITLAYSGDTNYAAVPTGTPVSWTTSKAALTVVVNSATGTYGAALPTLSGTVTGIVSGDGITATYSTTATTSSPIGPYPVTATLVDPNGKLGNYTVSNTPSTLTIGKAALTVVVNSATGTYGAALPTLSGTVTGVVSGDGITATYSTTATTSSPIGPYPVTATLVDPNAKLGNYTVSNTGNTLTIGKATLAVVANSATGTYGAVLPTLSGTVTGVVTGDGITATYSTTATSSSPIGPYPVTATLVDPNSKLGNYIVSNTPSTLTIGKATLTVVANSATGTYGAALPTLSGTVTGVISGDGITATYSTTATTSSPIGPYPVTATLVDPNSKLGNYTVSNTPSTLTIGKATLTVVVNSAAGTYGAVLPTLSGTVTGVVSGDGITATYSTTATASSPIGPYPITATLNDPNTKLGNYSVSNTPSTLTIGKATLTVVVNAATGTYGAVLPALSGTVTGVVTGDGITATYSTTATTSSPIGPYSITATLVDPNGKLGNYTVSNTPSNLTLGKATLAVTVNAKSMIYGSALPAFDGTVAGVVSGDGITATYSTTATTSSPIGPYPVTATLVDPNSKLGNYTVSNTGSTLTIGKATLTVVVNSATGTYGAALPTLSGTVTGIVSGDGITATYSTTGTTSSPIGPYPVTATLVDPNGKLGNYTVSNTGNTLTIGKATLTVTVNAKSMTYGAALPVFNGTVTGVVSGDGITATYSTTATSTSVAGGTYSITATLNDPNSKLGNYTVTNTPAALTIGKAALTVTVNSVSSSYGAALPAFSGTVTGVVAGDGITFSYSNTGTATSPVASTYPITATISDPNAKQGNYTITNTPGVLTLNKAALTVVVNPATGTYGAALPVFSGTVTGVVTGDGITASYSTTATSTSAVGPYPITAALNDPNGKLANYTLSNTASTLTLGKAALTIVVNPVTSTYGAAFPTFTGTLSGVAAGDGIIVAYSSTATPTSAAGGVYSITAALSDPNAKLGNYTVTNTPAVLNISKALATVSAPPVSRLYGVANPTLTANETGFLPADGITLTPTTTATLASPDGSYPITVALGDPNSKLGNYTVTNTGGTLTVLAGATTVTIVPSIVNVNSASNVTYTTTVASSSGAVPTGTVTLTAASGSTFGPFTLNASGIATGTGILTGAPLGTDIITATYSGDSNYAANAGTKQLTVGTAAYTLVAVPSSLTITRGQNASAVITLTPTFGYTGTATFSCAGLPAFASCIFSPSAVTADGSNTPVGTTMTVYTLASHDEKGPSGAAFWIPGAVLALLFCFGRKRMSKRIQHLLMLALLAAGAFGASGCGSQAFLTPLGTTQSTIVVNATGSAGTGSSNLQETLSISITINP